MTGVLPVFATRDRHHSANVHLIVGIGPIAADEMADMRSKYPSLASVKNEIATFACGGESGFDYQLVDSETEKPFCDRCLLADMNPAVYRVFDKFERLLYIGSTGSLVDRLIGHRSKKQPWLSLGARVTVDTYIDLRCARIAEAKAIASERPWFNQQGLVMPSVTGVR